MNYPTIQAWAEDPYSDAQRAPIAEAEDPLLTAVRATSAMLEDLRSACAEQGQIQSAGKLDDACAALKEALSRWKQHATPHIEL